MLENRGGQVRGIWQEPTQFAQALLLLAKGKFGIKSIISIGTFNGWTDIFLLFYLSRFYELDRFTSLDPYTYVEGKPDKYSFDPDVKKVLAAYNISIYEQLQLTSNELSAVCDVKSDFCMIDGLHTYGAVSTDWENVGKQAKICWFHDVNNHLVGFQNAPLFWKSNIEPFYETVKFLHDDDGMNRFGIGLKLPREHATAEGMKQVANPIQ